MALAALELRVRLLESRERSNRFALDDVRQAVEALRAAVECEVEVSSRSTLCSSPLHPRGTLYTIGERVEAIEYKLKCFGIC